MTSSPIGIFANDVPLYSFSSSKEYEQNYAKNPQYFETERNAYIFPYNNSYIILYKHCVQGYLCEDYLAHRKHDWPSWETYKRTPTANAVEKLVIKWAKGYPEALRERVPNTQQEQLQTRATNPTKTAIVPASLYSSWIFPDSEDSLVKDNWLSNLDQDICNFLHNTNLN